MKKLFLLYITLLACILFSCNTIEYTYYDDIYTSSQDPQYTATSYQTPEMSNKEEAIADSIIYEYDDLGNLLDTKTYYPGNPNPQITYYDVPIDNYSATSTHYDYDEDDYYDYYYTSRIRRFHTDLYSGWGYYDPYFTNLYWYDYCPSSWGLSIYMGYNWWWPSYYYRPYYYNYGWYDYGFHYGWGWNHPYYWHTPYYHYGCCSDWAAINYYHNNYDHNCTYYYGHRNSIGPSVTNPQNERGERPSDYEHPNNYGNNDNNNHYSATAYSSSATSSFNQRYSTLSASTESSDATSHNHASNTTNKQIILNTVDNRSDTPTSKVPTTHTNSTSKSPASPTNSSNTASNVPSKPTTTVISRTTTSTSSRANTTRPTTRTITPSTKTPSQTATPSRSSNSTYNYHKPSTTNSYNRTPSSSQHQNINTSRPSSFSNSAAQSRPNSSSYNNSSRSSSYGNSSRSSSYSGSSHSSSSSRSSSYSGNSSKR